MSLVYGQDDRVTRWVSEQLGHLEPPPGYAAIGFERNGELVAGVFFDGRTDTNVFAHIASSSPLMPPELLAAVYMYAFHQLKCERMTFMVDDDNSACKALCGGLGAMLEAELRRGHKNGSTLLYVLWQREFERTPFFQKLARRYMPSMAKA